MRVVSFESKAKFGRRVMEHFNILVQSTCPVCRRECVSSSKLLSILERVLLRAFRMHPFWCMSCDLRFYTFSPREMLRQAP